MYQCRRCAALQDKITKVVWGMLPDMYDLHGIEVECHHERRVVSAKKLRGVRS